MLDNYEQTKDYKQIIKMIFLMPLNIENIVIVK